MHKDDENLSFEFCVHFYFLEKVLAKGTDYFNQINEGKLEVEGVIPNSLNTHLIILLLQLKSQATNFHVLLAFLSGNEILHLFQTTVQNASYHELIFQGF